MLHQQKTLPIFSNVFYVLAITQLTSYSTFTQQLWLKGLMGISVLFFQGSRAHVIFPQAVVLVGALFQIFRIINKCIDDDNRCSDDNYQLTHQLLCIVLLCIRQIELHIQLNSQLATLNGPERYFRKLQLLIMILKIHIQFTLSFYVCE